MDRNRETERHLKRESKGQGEKKGRGAVGQQTKRHKRKRGKERKKRDTGGPKETKGTKRETKQEG